MCASLPEIAAREAGYGDDSDDDDIIVDVGGLRATPRGGDRPDIGFSPLV